MPRSRRAENAGLPRRWCRSHGAYYYQVPPGQEKAWGGKRFFRLGTTLPEAYRVWAAKLNADIHGETIASLLERYALEVVPKKAPKTRSENSRAIARLTGSFGAMKLTELEPQHVYQFVDKRTAKTAARREIEVLSHAFTKAVEWGYIRAHPFKNEVRLEGEAPRSRYVEDWEVIECLALVSRRKAGSVLAIQAYIRLKLMTGMARSDLLRLKMSDLKEDGIHIQRHKTAGKTGKRTIYAWSEELRLVVRMAKQARPVHLSPFLFCNRRGQGYFDEETGEAHGWGSMWQRFMDRVLAETKVVQRFTEHDLRAKCASDAETLEHARALLSHADARITERVYRRKPEIVTPRKSTW